MAKDLNIIGNINNHMVDKATNSKLEILGLYRSNYTLQFHVREIAKLLKKNHVTLLPHLKALEEDKVLVPKKMGKNKVYSLNLSNILTRDFLSLAEKYHTITYLQKNYLIKKLVGELIHFEGSLILFGSYAKKTEKKDSDIDLFHIGDIKPTQITKIKNIGKTYGKVINIKKASLKHFESSLRMKDSLVIEVLKNHILLQEQEVFINILWRYYNEIS
tara:strand:- start:16522 stop:17172 length:651 start_codon:yes stop_codon:yes gene_type:complete